MDGLVLSFLTFFNGTVDCFHLQQARAGVGFLNVSGFTVRVLGFSGVFRGFQGLFLGFRRRSVLGDGLVLSLLIFFNGTVDCFHLQQARRLPTLNLKTPSTQILPLLLLLPQ